MTKLKQLAAAVAIASVTSMAGAAAPEAPSMYGPGPLSPSANSTNLSEQERIAYALLEAVMQSTEAYIHGNGCGDVTLNLKVYSDTYGTDADPDTMIGNAVLGNLPNNALVLNAVAEDNAASFRGQSIIVTQGNSPAYINNTEVAGFETPAPGVIYNSANNMLVGTMVVDVDGIHGADSYTGSVIKDFYAGAEADQELHLVIDWGLQALLKEGYPIEKYWQRSKVRRSDGGQGATVFVKDRLVGNQRCRITVDLSGPNEVYVFDQSGTLTIESVRPDSVSTELGAITSP